MVAAGAPTVHKHDLRSALSSHLHQHEPLDQITQLTPGQCLATIYTLGGLILQTQRT